MLGVLAVIAAAYIWLGYETDWLRVRLLVGPEPIKAEPIKPKVYYSHKSIWDLKQDLAHQYSYKLSPGVEEVLCGWNWLFDNVHNLDTWLPTFELSINGSTHKLALTPETKGIVKEIMLINTRPHKPFVLPTYHPVKRNKYGGLVVPLPPRPH